MQFAFQANWPDFRVHATKIDELDQCCIVTLKCARTKWPIVMVLGSLRLFFWDPTIHFSFSFPVKKQFHVEEILCLHSSFSQLKSLVPFKKRQQPGGASLCCTALAEESTGSINFYETPCHFKKSFNHMGLFLQRLIFKWQILVAPNCFPVTYQYQSKMVSYKTNLLFSY